MFFFWFCKNFGKYYFFKKNMWMIWPFCDYSGCSLHYCRNKSRTNYEIERNMLYVSLNLTPIESIAAVFWKVFQTIHHIDQYQVIHQTNQAEQYIYIKTLSLLYKIFRGEVKPYILFEGWENWAKMWWKKRSISSIT